MLHVPTAGPFQLRFPVTDIGFWQSSYRAIGVRVPVPKAAVDKNHSSAAWENKIGLPRQVSPVQPEPITEAVRERTDDPFGLHAFGPNPRHAPRPIFRAKIVHHLASTGFSRRNGAFRLFAHKLRECGIRQRIQQHNPAPSIKGDHPASKGVSLKERAFPRAVRGMLPHGPVDYPQNPLVHGYSRPLYQR